MREAVGSHLLLAVGEGRIPMTSGSTRGIELDSRGYIVVDDQLRTGVPGIWAIGECNGQGAFTQPLTTITRSSQTTARRRSRTVRDRLAPTRCSSIRRSVASA